MPDKENIILDLLRILEDHYPNIAPIRLIESAVEGFCHEHKKALFTLHEEGLIKAEIVNTLAETQISGAKITAKGRKRLDGKEEYITVKFHEDTLEALRVLLLDSLTRTTLPDGQKSSLKKAIESAPAKAVDVLVSKILEAGLEKTPDLLSQIPLFLSRLS